MQVFTLFDPNQTQRQVDLFIEAPVEFEDLWERSVETSINGLSIRIAAIDDLIRMKELANRPIDHDDIQALRKIQRQQQSE